MHAVKRMVSNPTFRQSLLYSAAGLPFLLAIAFQIVGPQMREPLQAAERPALAFDQYLVNLGPTEPSQQVFARFSFTNASDRTVEIKELKPSCGCLNPRLAKRIYGPGEPGEFSLRVQTANEQPGPKTYYCKIIYDDGKPREADVTFKLTLPEKTVIVRPKALAFYQFNDQPTYRDIVVTDFRMRKLQLTGVECSTKFANVALGDPGFDPDGNRLHKIIVLVQKVPPGRHRGLITIHTDDPKFPQLRVPLLIEGPHSKALRVGTEAQDSDHRSRQ